MKRNTNFGILAVLFSMFVFFTACSSPLGDPSSFTTAFDQINSDSQSNQGNTGNGTQVREGTGIGSGGSPQGGGGIQARDGTGIGDGGPPCGSPPQGGGGIQARDGTGIGNDGMPNGGGGQRLQDGSGGNPDCPFLS